MQIKQRNETVDLITESTNDEVFLTITIGNAQIGGSIIKFENSTNIGKGEIENLNLGKASDLVGKTLQASTNILDINQQTNGVAVTYFFSSCLPPAISFFDKVDNDGDIFSFSIDFNFKSQAALNNPVTAPGVKDKASEQDDAKDTKDIK